MLDSAPWSATTAGVAAEIAPKATSRPAVMLAILLNMSFPSGCEWQTIGECPPDKFKSSALHPALSSQRRGRNLTCPFWDGRSAVSGLCHARLGPKSLEIPRFSDERYDLNVPT